MQMDKNMTDYILVDLHNMFHRAKHVSRGPDIETRIGMCLHILFSSMNFVSKKFGGHVIIASEGRSWRKDVYPIYKENRKVLQGQISQKDLREVQAMYDALDDTLDFFKQKTNCTVLQHPEMEADDLIAAWVQKHKDKHHVIVSSDSDYLQLIKPNVEIYNGITNNLITLDGYFDNKGNLLKETPDPEWMLFQKCMRGDSSDNVKSAYPGVRTKSTKNKIGLLEAFNDRNKKGFAWNNLMLQRWVDHDNNEHKVIDAYLQNKELIDLANQPKNIREKLDNCIHNIEPKKVSMVGIHFMKFCGKYSLTRAGEQVNEHVLYLNRS
jgi:5'-3' exonuclease